MTVSVYCLNPSPNFRVDLSVSNPTGLSSVGLNGSDLDKDFPQQLNESLRNALSKLTNPVRVSDLEACCMLVVHYKEVDIYGFQDLFVTDNYLEKTKNGDIILNFRLKNRNGIILKSKGTSSGSPKYDADCIGSFTAEGKDNRPLNYFVKITVDPKTGELLDFEFTETFMPKARITIKSSDIKNLQKVADFSVPRIQSPLHGQLYSKMMDIVELMEFQALIPAFKRLQSTSH